MVRVVNKVNVFSIDSICERDGNYYHFVMAIAKRARALGDESSSMFNAEIKPVSMALSEFVEHKWNLIE
jgi:DNA-directed RNA polymerase subunit K/omega